MGGLGGGGGKGYGYVDPLSNYWGVLAPLVRPLPTPMSINLFAQMQSVINTADKHVSTGLGSFPYDIIF